VTLSENKGIRSFEAFSEKEMIDVGKKIASFLVMPSIVCLMGDLGVGKTTLAKGIISELTRASTQEITSPTFQYVHLYEQVAHFDLWRLRDISEFLALGLDECLFDRISLIEWPDRIEGWLPKDVTTIGIRSFGDGRKVDLGLTSICHDYKM
jgi:tRNA threonylcarbamoyladenosine biosynthesis protein TsaE